MRLPDEVQKCVVFIGHEGSGGRIEYRGTGFLVSVPSWINNGNFVYLVTARHVVEQLTGKPYYLRVNIADGSSKEYEFTPANQLRWFDHPTDQTVDVAVAMWVPPKEDKADYLTIPQNIFLDPTKMLGKGITVGDEVYVTGLLPKLPGIKRNLPIVRTGNIALLPSEPVPIANGFADHIEAYLIEARSLGGLSGSPVFAQRSIGVQAVEHSGRVPVAAGAIFLFGLVHGHWSLPRSEVGGQPGHEKINTGLSIVVPAHKILETLRQDELIERERVASVDLEDQHHNVLEGGSPERVRDGQEVAATEALHEAASKRS